MESSSVFRPQSIYVSRSFGPDLDAVNKRGKSPAFARSNPRLTAFATKNFTFQSLSDYTQRNLQLCPDSGGGVHDWIYHVACLQIKEGVPPRIIASLIEIATEDCDRIVPGREINEAIQSASMAHGIEAGAAAASKDSGKQNEKANPIPKDYPLIEKIARDGSGLRALPAIGGHRQAPDLRPNDVLPYLFPEDALVCAGTKRRFHTRPLQSWLAAPIDHMPLVVVNPMSSVSGRTKAGYLFQRCLANTGPRRFLVVEFDFKETNGRGEHTPDAPMLRSLAKDGISIADLGVSLHLHLSTIANLVMIVNSGNKSEHGWFFTAGMSEVIVKRFIRYARGLGGDKAMENVSQMFRMPGPVRENSKARQVVRYFEPEKISA